MEAFVTLELVGQGSFGKVYKGRRRGTAEIVALKFIPKRSRTTKELQVSARIWSLPALPHHDALRAGRCAALVVGSIRSGRLRSTALVFGSGAWCFEVDCGVVKRLACSCTRLHPIVTLLSPLE